MAETIRYTGLMLLTTVIEGGEGEGVAEPAQAAIASNHRLNTLPKYRNINLAPKMKHYIITITMDSPVDKPAYEPATPGLPTSRPMNTASMKPWLLPVSFVPKKAPG